MLCKELQGFGLNDFQSDEAVHEALEHLNASLVTGTVNCKIFLEAAIQQGYRLEFILSGMILRLLNLYTILMLCLQLYRSPPTRV